MLRERERERGEEYISRYGKCKQEITLMDKDVIYKIRRRTIFERLIERDR